MEGRGTGNGPISAAVHALQAMEEVLPFTLDNFVEQSIGRSADATAVAYISLKRESDGKIFYGCGENPNIDKAAMYAIFAALNRAALD